jgi:hypothetical protein
MWQRRTASCMRPAPLAKLLTHVRATSLAVRHVLHDWSLVALCREPNKICYRVREPSIHGEPNIQYVNHVYQTHIYNQWWIQMGMPRLQARQTVR